MKKIYTLIFIALVFSTLASAQITETPLFTGEKSPEAFSYYDLLGWVKTDAAIVGKYVNFGTAEAPVNISLVDNPDKAGVNKTDKALILKSLSGKSWWPDFSSFVLTEPITITSANRYLHFYHYRQNLNEGYSVNINAETPWEDPDKGTKRFDSQLTKAGVWEDVVIDLKWFMDNAEAFSKICILNDRNWGGGAQNPTDYYFDEFALSSDALPRGVTLLNGPSILSGESQAQTDALIFNTQNATNTYEVIDNPFETSTVNNGGKIVKFHKSADASWWQGLNITFPGMYLIKYDEAQYLHVMVRANKNVDFQLHVVDNSGAEHTSLLTYPFDELSGEWFDLVWDLSSYTAIKAMTVRCDVQTDAVSGAWINNTPADDFFIDEIVLDKNPDQRTEIITVEKETALFTGEKSPEAFSYYDLLGWVKTDAAIVGKYVNFGTAEAPVNITLVDNPDKTGVNKTDKALILKSLSGKSWWPDFSSFVLTEPITITSANRYLHFFHYRQNLNQGYSVNINAETPWEDPDKGTKRFDSQLTKAGVWEDVVIDLKWFMDNAEAFSKICILNDRNWGGGAEDPTDYYFDEFALSDDALPRGVTLLNGPSILSCESQSQTDALIFNTQNGTNTYEVIDNPFKTSAVNKGGKIVKFHKSADASWWQGFNITFPGMYMIKYDEAQYLHVMVRANKNVDFQLHVVDNSGAEHTALSPYPFDELSGEWFDLVWDLSSYTAIKAMTVRCDVRTDAVSGDWINNTPADDFYIDDIVLDKNSDQRTEIVTGIKNVQIERLSVYAIDRTININAENLIKAEVYDITGRLIAAKALTAGDKSIAVPSEGIYIVRATTTEGTKVAKIFVK